MDNWRCILISGNRPNRIPDSRKSFPRIGQIRLPLSKKFLGKITVLSFLKVPHNPDLSEEFLDNNKRFHPSVIGTILAVFMFSIASFISYIEDISYFDAFYACFITYSTIGFGDIDIYVSSLSKACTALSHQISQTWICLSFSRAQRISYRANWFNLMIYGNGVHILGYMIISAWISSILDKCGIRKF